ncbi:hypothetical protein OEZ85_003822 [Tetradesmus obliquus]|uniref:H15 domain-containing protein n=1 Tax=Tetradesmus obliquus TaxID=3088 RepID=A0ABY8UCG6_TETOB|nr:hypothetical protein OEZ85_003822 [Tetradesmus obliquus]
MQEQQQLDRQQQRTAELQQLAAEQRQQPAEQQAPLPIAAPAPADPDAQRRGKLAAVQPTQPAMQILKVLKESEQPLTSHELQARVQQQYTSITTRRQFKNNLKGLWRQKYVASMAPGKASAAAAARSGNKKAQKVSDGHWLFSVTHLGQKVDLNAPGKPLQAAAMRAADEWTRAQLPEYARHMREGRVPVTWQNLGVLSSPKQREEQYQRRLLFGGDRAGRQQQQQLVPGGAAAVADVSRQPQKPQKKQK